MGQKGKLAKFFLDVGKACIGRKAEAFQQCGIIEIDGGKPGFFVMLIIYSVEKGLHHGFVFFPAHGQQVGQTITSAASFAGAEVEKTIPDIVGSGGGRIAAETKDGFGFLQLSQSAFQFVY